MNQTTRYDVHEIHPRSPFAAWRFARAATRTPRCTFALILCVLIVTVAPAFGRDRESTDGAVLTQPINSAGKARIDQARDIPRISGALYPKIHNKLQQAYPVAVDHLRNNSECRDLFAELGANGFEKLSTTLYSQSTVTMERSFCRGGVTAITVVECPSVRLCKRFASLGTVEAAKTLIHEALHFAGMSEWPKDPQGLNPREINALVKKSCGF